MIVRQFFILSSAVALGLIVAPCLAQADTGNDASTQCEALKNVDFSQLQDAPTQITEAEWVEASDDLQAYCRARGYVTPNVGIEILLPTSNWNGKFLEIGCGGSCGVLVSSPPFRGCDRALRKGYVCIASDMGHQGGGELWGYNNLQAEIDFGFRATHVTALAGKAITEYFYGNAAAKSYFMGCSTGGRQGLIEAQRFPWDFDGIVAGAPAINLSATRSNLLWASLAVQGNDGKPIFQPTDLRLLHEAALAKCDIDDGVKDGVIGNPPACQFDPATLICRAGATNRCLSKEQAEAARKIYSGPTTSTGKQIYTRGPMPGTELGFGYAWAGSFVRDKFRYLQFMPDPGPGWQPQDFDFDRDYKRLGMIEAISAGTDPDLRRFKANGGKLILYHGWADGDIVPSKTVDYYETVERTMGGRAPTREFLRFFMIPGMAHCGGGAGANDFDFLSYLEAWVEKGQAPDVIIGAHVDFDKFLATGDSADWEKFARDPENRIFTRPVYLYPAYAKYKGKGDSNDAANFRPIQP